MEKKPEAVLQAWLKGVNTADVDAIASLYADEAVLLPTFSNKVVVDTAGRLEYFNGLGAKKGLAVEVHDDTVKIQNVAGSAWSLGGLYTWRFEVDGELKSFLARFTFTVDVAREKPIFHHHSSLSPES